jgi:hypothetical protein
MRIIGIDPGTEKSAYVIWDGTAVHGNGIVPNEQIVEILETAKDSPTVAVEHMECHGMAVGKETFETAYWIGEFRLACKYMGHPWVIVMRSQEKMHLCQSPRAKDGNVRQALIDKIGPVGVKASQGPLYGISSHCWQALAVAVVAYDRLNVAKEAEFTLP